MIKEICGHILVADDSRLSRYQLAQGLKQAGHTVRLAEDGQQALALIRQHTFDLILLDIKMPGIEGYEVCQALKSDEQTADIPVIFLSVLGETEDKVKAFTFGGVDYITKPFNLKEVLARAQTHLTLRYLQKQLQWANEELQSQLEELETRNEELDAFAHTVAHELRGPITIISGLAEVLESSSDSISPENLQQYHGLIARNGRKMANIIDELLLLAGVRKMKVDPQPLDMATIIASAQDRLADMIAEYRPELILPEQWPVAYGYAPWVEEVWVNYMSNAIKYGGQPPRLELGGTRQAGDMVYFWIRDNGPGLAPEAQARLFTAFERLSQTRAKGHGLGLSIVQRIIHKLGGQVGVESEEGQGSLFYFILPAHPPANSSTTGPAKPSPDQEK